MPKLTRDFGSGARVPAREPDGSTTSSPDVFMRRLGGNMQLQTTAWISRFTRTALVMVAAMTLTTGCALFGGSDEEDLGGGGNNPGGDFSTGEGGDDFGQNGTPVSVSELETIYFDYDRASIRDDQKPTLRNNGTAVQNNSWRTVIIEGHCDERGSEEYNLALGERRANAVKQYMVDLGVAGNRIDTVSFGESRPSAPGHDESAWRFNRRAEFRVIR